jgi:hypothetical protein
MAHPSVTVLGAARNFLFRNTLPTLIGTKYSPLYANPFRAKKFRGLPTYIYSPEHAKEFDERVRIDSFASHIHNWLYVTPVEG